MKDRSGMGGATSEIGQRQDPEHGHFQRLSDRHVRRYAAEQGLAENVAIERGLQEKAAEFATAGGELYQKP